MAAPTIVGGSPAGVPAAASITVNKPAGLQDGDLLVVALRAQGVTTGEITMPTGWARSTGNQLADRAQGIFYKPVPIAANETATTYLFSGWASGRAVAISTILRGVDLANPIGGGDGYRTTNPNAYTVSAAPYTVLALWGDERTSPNSHVPTSTPAGYTQVINIQSTLDTTTVGSRTAIWGGTYTVPDGGTLNVAAPALVWAVPSAQRASTVAFRGLPTVPAAGLPVKRGDGSNAFLSYQDGASVRRIPTRVALWLPGFASVTALLAKAGATVAHRGGSANWPEMSQYAYDHSVMRGFGGLEFSCGWTSDLVPFGLGTQYLDSVAGVTGNVDPTTMTWATLAATYQNKLRPVLPGVYQPFYRLDAFLAKFTRTHVCLVDPKFGFSIPANVTKLLDVCDAGGGPSKIILKFDSPTTNTVLTTAAHARGYQCMNYWDTIANSAALTAQQAAWDIIGARFDDAAMMTQANSYGKPVWGAVAGGQTDYNTGMANGADFMMMTDVAGTVPVR